MPPFKSIQENYAIIDIGLMNFGFSFLPLRHFFRNCTIFDTSKLFNTFFNISFVKDCQNN